MTFGILNPQTGQTTQQGSLQQALMGGGDPTTGNILPVTGGGLPVIPPLTSTPGVTTTPTPPAPTPTTGGGMTFGNAASMMFPNGDSTVQALSGAPDTGWLLSKFGVDPAAAYDPTNTGWAQVRDYFRFAGQSGSRGEGSGGGSGPGGGSESGAAAP